MLQEIRSGVWEVEGRDGGTGFWGGRWCIEVGGVDFEDL